MSNDTDDRKIEDVPFACDSPDREFVRKNIIQILSDRGARTAQDVIDLGCTGLVGAKRSGAAVLDVRDVRSNMAGAGFGLPCYVPPTRYCLVHNTIGGLQPGQKPRHSEFVDLCSRPLTPEEQGHTTDMQALINKEGAAKAKRLFGAERIEPEAPNSRPTPKPRPDDDMFMEERRSHEARLGLSPARNLLGHIVDCDQPVVSTAPVPLDLSFACPEHAHSTLVWACRYCLAAAVINGPIQPEVFLELQRRDGGFGDEEIENLDAVLADKNYTMATAFVRVKCWKQQMVETNE